MLCLIKSNYESKSVSIFLSMPLKQYAKIKIKIANLKSHTKMKPTILELL